MTILLQADPSAHPRGFLRLSRPDVGLTHTRTHMGARFGRNFEASMRVREPIRRADSWLNLVDRLPQSIADAAFIMENRSQKPASIDRRGVAKKSRSRAQGSSAPAGLRPM